MESRFGGASLLLRSVLEACAEEAERIMLEIGASEEKLMPQPVTIFAERYTERSSHFRKAGYFCPSCSWPEIMRDHRFCSGCGRPIAWSYKALPPSAKYRPTNKKKEKDL
ncbi:hypothetical protein [Flaviaesturariibacter amylovorans]